jgi:hypothetical protein
MKIVHSDLHNTLHAYFTSVALTGVEPGQLGCDRMSMGTEQ